MAAEAGANAVLVSVTFMGLVVLPWVLAQASRLGLPLLALLGA